MVRKLCIFTFLLHISIIVSNSFASAIPKREFRGAWIATIVNLDWPSAPGLSSDQQRAELCRLLDQLHDVGINAIILQVRPECDAFYPSPFDPWSYYLTGKQGKAPSPYYDPLEFAIREAHQRGMELHAWFNPYRAVREIGAYPLDPGHVSNRHPDWTIQIGSIKVLNPGLSSVRNYVTAVIMDVVRRYDIDGVHFDDYFYPYPPNSITNQDDAAFANDPRGFTDRGEWRRDNVNLLIQMVHDSIQAVKPFIKFGVSPFGIWKNGVPPGTTGFDAYNEIYADAVAWLNHQWVDYLAPQLYWPFGGAQDYGKLLPWWASQTNGRHLYPGLAIYKISGWSTSEVPNQIRLNRQTSGVSGNIFFRTTHVIANLKGFTDSLKNDLHRYPAVQPIMAWKDVLPPNPPGQLGYAPLTSYGPPMLQWQQGFRAADGDSGYRFVIYRSKRPDFLPDELEDAQNIIAIVGDRHFAPPIPGFESGPYYYLVTALDRNANESQPSQTIAIYPPGPPTLVFPNDGSDTVPQSVRLEWRYQPDASHFHLQLAKDADFTYPLLVDRANIPDTFSFVTGLSAQTCYYWRVRAANAGGCGDFSRAYRFITGFPKPPVLVYPANQAVDVPIEPVFIWQSVANAESYQLQTAKNSTFLPGAIVVDSSGIIDTTFAGAKLSANRFYYWRVRATNWIGSGEWSEVYKFKTVLLSNVLASEPAPSFRLYPNHPNPFNAKTTIEFDLPQSMPVKVKVFDSLGREIFIIVDDIRPAGKHQLIFDGSALPSGIYLYSIKVGSLVAFGKMLLLK